MCAVEPPILARGSQKYSTIFLAAEQSQKRKKKKMKLIREDYHVFCKRITRKFIMGPVSEFLVASNNNDSG